MLFQLRVGTLTVPARGCTQHFQKNYYKTIDGKEAQSIYISRVMMKIKFFF